MELRVQLKVSANEVYDQLLNLITEDVKISTGKSVSVDKLQKDFSYKKSIKNQLGMEVPVKVTINELSRPTRYTASIKCKNETNTMDYLLCDKANGVEITFKESFKSTSILRNLNYFFASLVYSKRSKKKMRAQFAHLEQLILNSKGNSLTEEDK